MGDSRWFDAARKAAGTAAADAKDRIAGAAADAKARGLAALQDALADFNAALPILREAGYVLDEVKIRIGLSPKITALFSGVGTLSDDRVDALLAEHGERPLTALMVRAVRQAAALQSRLTITGMRPAGLAVDVGLIPEVTVRFIREARRDLPPGPVADDDV